MMDNKYINQLQMGSIFAETSGATLCLKKPKPISKIELVQIKNRITEYLKKQDKAYITEISEALKVEPKKIVLAIKELKEEGILILA